MARRTIDAHAEYIGAEQTLEIGQRPTHEDIVKEVDMSAAEREAFMQELVTVVVQSSGQENEAPMVAVGVNGVMQYLRRDVPQRIKRKFVEALARAKRADYDQMLDDRLGDQMNLVQRRNSLRFPFTVVEDRNPRGGAWLREVLAQP
ncbi:hypothetical protein EII18_03055 [Comamonadaceae bacterium OH3737_COT-264]|nr:hypothetical protein EII18_03055 [Comamonadaceae bacterium OH3737_COT-264]